jgi:hypothetical protein
MNFFLRLSCLAFTFAAAQLAPLATFSDHGLRADGQLSRCGNQSGLEEVTSAPEKSSATLAFYIPRPLRGSQAFYIPRPLRGSQV